MVDREQKLILSLLQFIGDKILKNFSISHVTQEEGSSPCHPQAVLFQISEWMSKLLNWHRSSSEVSPLANSYPPSNSMITVE